MASKDTIMTNKEGEERKTLKSALEGLQTRSDSLVEARMLSDKLFDKFKHPLSPLVEVPLKTGINCPESELDIIDLFNEVSDNIQIDIDMIHKNLSAMLDMMD